MPVTTATRPLFLTAGMQRVVAAMPDLMIAFALGTLLLHRHTRASYGKLGGTERGAKSREPGAASVCGVRSRIAWAVFEIPNIVIPLAVMICTRNSVNIPCQRCSAMLLFVAHYFHRAIIYPLRLPSEGKKIPYSVVLSAFAFTSYNALMQALFLLVESKPSMAASPRAIRQIFGATTFLAGLYINIASDYHLLTLKRQSNTERQPRRSCQGWKHSEYQVPTAGLFRYSSCANYFGEALEWTGWALLAHTKAAYAFAFFVWLYLGGRAMHHHEWYLATFPKYPIERKAFIPFVL